MLTCKHVTALQLGQLVNLNPIDLLGDSIPDVGVPPLNVPNLLGVQFLGARQSVLYPAHLECFLQLAVRLEFHSWSSPNKRDSLLMSMALQGSAWQILLSPTTTSA
jgi:hypothetical protein